jgi:hypothetical protein
MASERVVLIVGSESSGTQMLYRWLTECREPTDIPRETASAYEIPWERCGECWACGLAETCERFSMPHGNRERGESHWPDDHDFAVCEPTHVIWTRRSFRETVASKVRRGHSPGVPDAIIEVIEAEKRIIAWLAANPPAPVSPELLVVQFEAAVMRRNPYPFLLGQFLELGFDVRAPMKLHEENARMGDGT